MTTNRIGIVTLLLVSVGQAQSAPAKDWASFTGRAAVKPGGPERALTIIVDRRDPAAPGMATVILELEGARAWRGRLTIGSVSIK